MGAENTFTAVEIAVAKKVVRAVKDCPEAWDMIYGAATEVPAIGNILGSTTLELKQIYCIKERVL